NLFLSSRLDGMPLIKVLDFGISKAMMMPAIHCGATPANSQSSQAQIPLVLEGAQEREVTQPGGAVGTPSYMSPEQIVDASTVEGGGDVWGLGVVMYQLLTDALPFQGPSSTAIVAKVTSRAEADEPRAIRDLRSDLPEGLARVIHKCLAKERCDRFVDVAEL